MLAGGVPCPPFSRAGKQLGANDERDLFPQALRLVDECRPKAVMLENVRGLLDAVFDDYRNKVEQQLKKLGYTPGWRLLNASDYGVSQLRPRVVFVAIHKDVSGTFQWAEPLTTEPPTVGALLLDLMKANKWRGAEAWATLGVDGMGLVDEAPARDFVGMPRLTPRMTGSMPFSVELDIKGNGG